ncbi:Uncharacterised protein [Candidatus Ornithobacterium hominis]|uniref:Uncharacterized protein n=1 Tax=Candidatus Ornithobacterium hominis TaxID=2497989 RepID=A0A383U0N5_9FLAO|nr:Uncharacterised protein [Candidatus Ornithobacterium hominis]
MAFFFTHFILMNFNLFWFVNKVENRLLDFFFFRIKFYFYKSILFFKALKKFLKFHLILLFPQLLFSEYDEFFG